MGDFRLNVKISVVGRDGKEHKRDLWLNWHEDRPVDVYKAVIEAAEEGGLDVHDQSYLFD